MFIIMIPQRNKMQKFQNKTKKINTLSEQMKYARICLHMSSLLTENRGLAPFFSEFHKFAIEW